MEPAARGIAACEGRSACNYRRLSCTAVPWRSLQSVLSSELAEQWRRGDPADRPDLAELLGVLVPARPAWQSLAACRGMPTSWWFPKGDKVEPIVRATCAACPVAIECGRQALAVGEVGVWGGATERERRAGRRAA